MTALKTLSHALLDTVLEKARHSPRRRANHNLHGPEDTLQRMVNAMLRGTYCQPHKHEQPDKLEIFTVLRGEAAVLTFDDGGAILEIARFSAAGPVCQVEIPPRTWHTVIALSDAAILYEVIEGVYDPKTHKRFAPFAPGEQAPGAEAYLQTLTDKVLAARP